MGIQRDGVDTVSRELLRKPTRIVLVEQQLDW
jgi:hypothetical protein